MTRWMNVSLACAVILVACTEPIEPPVDTAAQAIAVIATDAGPSPDGPTLGPCGANRDQSLGVDCAYEYTGPTGPPTYVGHQLLPGGETTSDVVSCTWQITCMGRLTGSRSAEGRACVAVHGSGCPAPWPRVVEVRVIRDLPGGTTDGQLGAVCQAQPPAGFEAPNRCAALRDTVQLFEDYCCSARVIDEFIDTLIRPTPGNQAP